MIKPLSPHHALSIPKMFSNYYNYTWKDTDIWNETHQRPSSFTFPSKNAIKDIWGTLSYVQLLPIQHIPLCFFHTAIHLLKPYECSIAMWSSISWPNRNVCFEVSKRDEQKYLNECSFAMWSSISWGTKKVFCWDVDTGMEESFVPRVIVTEKLVRFRKSLSIEGDMLRNIKVDVKKFFWCVMWCVTREWFVWVLKVGVLLLFCEVFWWIAVCFTCDVCLLGRELWSWLALPCCHCQKFRAGADILICEFKQ